MHRDRLDIALALVQRVDELDVAVAAQAEGVGDFFLDQVVYDDLAAIESVIGRSFQHCSGVSCRIDERGTASGIANDGRMKRPNGRPRPS
jgi:hypothetical protein